MIIRGNMQKMVIFGNIKSEIPSPPLGVVVLAKIFFAYNSLKRKKKLLDSNKKMSK